LASTTTLVGRDPAQLMYMSGFICHIILASDF